MMEHRYVAVIDAAVVAEALSAVVEASFEAAARVVEVKVTVESDLPCEEITQQAQAAGWAVLSCGSSRRSSRRAMAAGTEAVLLESFSTASDFVERGIDLPAVLSITSAEVEAVAYNSDAAAGGDGLQNAMFDSVVSNLEPQLLDAFALEGYAPVPAPPGTDSGVSTPTVDLAPPPAPPV